MSEHIPRRMQLGCSTEDATLFLLAHRNSLYKCLLNKVQSIQVFKRSQEFFQGGKLALRYS